MAVSSDNQILTFGFRDNTVLLWNPVTGELIQTLGSHSGRVTLVTFLPVRQLVVSASEDNTVRL
jgi:WD40 repeat protein